MNEVMKKSTANPYIIIIGTQKALPKEYQPDILLKALFQVAAFKFSDSYQIVVVGTNGASIGDWNKEEMRLDYDDNKERKYSADLAHAVFKDLGNKAYLMFFNFDPPLLHTKNPFMHPGFVPWLVLYRSISKKEIVPFWKITDCLPDDSTETRICLVSYNNQTCKVEADNLLQEMWERKIHDFGFLHH